jgi:hypothetical protein
MKPMGNRMRRRGDWAVALFLMVGFGPAGAEVTIDEIEYRGWAGAVQIQNGDVRVVVVPQIGRIMHYGFVGGQNVLWNNPDLLGQVLPEDGPPVAEDSVEWQNYGGDKIWPNEQDDFEAINDRSWPPDHWFDGHAQAWERIEGGVRITSPVSPANGARVIREIRLAGDGTRLQIGQRLEKVQMARHSQLEPLRYTIWNVTQLRTPQVALLPLNPHSIHPDGARIWDDTPRERLEVRGDVGLFVPHPTDAQKVGVDSDRWLGAIVDDIVIGEFYRRDATKSYPDQGLSAEVYTSATYTELELLSPLMPLAPGQQLRFEIAWELHRLPASATDDTARITAALEWLRIER